MFSNGKQNIPELFRQKMVVDRDIKDLVSTKVFPTERLPELKALQRRRSELRRACEEFMKKANSG